ncbi:hypothetical protein DSECCO2_316290 [anaerobic digester metagenome]
MDTIGKAMEKIIRKCDVCVNGDVISKELLIKTFADFLSSTIEKENHNIGIVMHTGSICFDALMLSYAAISDILYNTSDPDKVIHSLLPGDMVLYYNSNKPNAKAQRYTFKGFASSPDFILSKDGDFVVLEQDANGRTILPKRSWSRIIPYFGKSTALNGIGIKKDNGKRNKFFKAVLELQDSEIPRTINASTVIVMSKEISQSLINGLTFRFDGEEVKYTELVTVSYFTENDQEYPYGSNVAKTEPVIKITSKVSVARRLLLKHESNRNIGLIVLGEELLRRGETELPELIERKSIQYVYLCSHIDSEIIEKLLFNYENAGLFACTKDFLLSYTKTPKMPNKLINELSAQTDIIIEREIQSIDSYGFLSLQEYKSFKEVLKSIKYSEYDSDEKNDFIMYSYSLMNLFLTAPFTMGFLDSLIESEKIDNLIKPLERIYQLKDKSATFPNYLKQYSDAVINTLEISYFKLQNACDKADKLQQLLSSNQNKKIAVIVPKAYYISVLNALNLRKLTKNPSNLTFVTANRFNNRELFDLIVVLGNVKGTRFDTFRNRSAKNIDVLLYKVEQTLHKRKMNKAKEVEALFNKRSLIATDYEEFVINTEEVEFDDTYEMDEDEDFPNFLNKFTGKAFKQFESSGNKHSLADIVAIAKFDTDEAAFFTKNYKAYVLDEADKTVSEIKVNDLAAGDTIVFTRSTSKTRDIVDGLLRQLIIDGLVPKDLEVAYNKSKLWRTTLIDYMNNTGTSSKKLAETMISNGVSVQEITIRGWLDEDSHTVGPRQMDSIQQIALIAGNEEMLDNAEDYFNACATVRRVRRSILDAIGQAIIGKINGDIPNQDPIFTSIYSKIGDLAVILQIETISFINDKIPVNMTNRPIIIE